MKIKDRPSTPPRCIECSWFMQERLDSRGKEFDWVCVNASCSRILGKVNWCRYYSGIPPEFFKRDLYALDKDQYSGAVVDFIKNYAGLPPSWVVIVGPTGAGKTELACQILRRAAIQDEKGIQYIHLPSYFDTLRNAENGKNPTERELQLRADHYDKIQNARLLLMDDLYMGNNSEYRQKQVYDLIDYRWAYGLTTILTTQLSMTEMRLSLSDKTVSRILQRAKLFKAGLKDRRSRSV